jgi:hypothetical protein
VLIELPEDYQSAFSVGVQQLYMERRFNLQLFTRRDISPGLRQRQHWQQVVRLHLKSVLVDFHPALSGKIDLQGKLRKSIHKGFENIPCSRRVPLQKTKRHPFPLLDINVGSPVGVGEMIEEIQKRMGQAEGDQGPFVPLVLGGDWLSAVGVDSVKGDRGSEAEARDRLEHVHSTAYPFHFGLNAMAALIKIYYGSPPYSNNSAALHHTWMQLANRTMNKDKPDYYDALALMDTHFVSAVLEMVRYSHGIKTVAGLAGQKIDSEEALEAVTSKMLDDQRFDTFINGAAKALGERDEVLASLLFFCRDYLFLKEYLAAVRCGDVGRMWEVYRHWVDWFKGVGLSNYANYTMELFVRFHCEYPPELAAAIEASWMTNHSGKVNGFVGTDYSIEHDVRTVKVGAALFAAQTDIPTGSPVSRSRQRRYVLHPIDVFGLHLHHARCEGGDERLLWPPRSAPRTLSSVLRGICTGCEAEHERLAPLSVQAWRAEYRHRHTRRRRRRRRPHARNSGAQSYTSARCSRADTGRNGKRDQTRQERPRQGARFGAGWRGGVGIGHIQRSFVSSGVHGATGQELQASARLHIDSPRRGRGRNPA